MLLQVEKITMQRMTKVLFGDCSQAEVGRCRKCRIMLNMPLLSGVQDHFHRNAEPPRQHHGQVHQQPEVRLRGVGQLVEPIRHDAGHRVHGDEGQPVNTSVTRTEVQNSGR